MELLTDAGLVSARERRRSFIYAELASQDIPFICATSLIKGGDHNVGLAVLRSHSQGEIDADQLRSFSAIAPQVRAAVRTQAALEGKAAQLLSGALEALALPVFICNAAGCVCAMTLGAEALVSGRNGIALKQGWLRLERPDETRDLATAIQRAALGLTQPVEPLTATLLAHRQACKPLVLDVVSLPRRPYSFGFEPRALVVVHSKQPNQRRSHFLLQAAYHLTAAEVAVALQLATGLAPEVIAVNRSVSIGTVRAQIRAIYTKLGVRRQIELVARLRELGCF